jgi:hypothetical protein
MIKCVCGHEYDEKSNMVLITAYPYIKREEYNILFDRQKPFCLYSCPKCKTTKLGEYKKQDWL